MAALLFFQDLMDILSYEEDAFSAYNLLFNRTHFAFLTPLNLQNLKYFSHQNQQTLGKIDIKFNINAIKGLPQNRKFTYIIMTNYKQILSIPYLLRSQTEQVTIITTKSMLHSARIYAQDFYKTVKKIDQVVKYPSYQEQTTVYDDYEIKFGRDFNQWVGIFSKQELSECFEKCVALNYGERHTTETGNVLIPYPSGETVGSAVWLIENIKTKQNLLWIQTLSHHSWRACKQFKIDKIHKKIDHIIIAGGALRKFSENNADQFQCQAFLETILNRLLKNLNTKIVLKDFLVICDIINFIVYKYKERFKKIFATGLSASKLIAYVNSYVEYLTENHRNRIYEDPPVYPFQSFQDLKQKNYNQGINLQEISDTQKVPLKELILRSTPYIQFQSDFRAYLDEGETVVTETVVEPCVNPQKLVQWIHSCQIRDIRCFFSEEIELTNILKLKEKLKVNLEAVKIGQKISIAPSNPCNYITAEGDISRIVSSYEKINGDLSLTAYPSQLRILDRDWHLIFRGDLQQAGIEATICQSQQKIQISTAFSKITMSNYQVTVKSSSPEEILAINRIFAKISQPYKFY